VKQLVIPRMAKEVILDVREAFVKPNEALSPLLVVVPGEGSALTGPQIGSMPLACELDPFASQDTAGKNIVNVSLRTLNAREITGRGFAG
jgi:hypothetical protein